MVKLISVLSVQRFTIIILIIMLSLADEFEWLPRYGRRYGDLVKVIDPEDIYPFCLVDNPLSAIKGSCWTYTTRKEVEKGLTWP